MSDVVETTDAPEPSLKKRAAKGAVWITLEMIGVQATSFAVFVAMAHFVGPRDFGLISISYLAIQSLQMLFINNIPTVVARKNKGTDLEYTTTFWVALGFGVLLFLILFAFSDLAEQLFNAPGLAPVLRSMSVIILFMGLARTHETWLTRHFFFQKMALRAFAGALVGGVVGLTMAVKGFGVMALVGQQIVTSVVSLLLLWITCPWRPNFQFSTQTYGEILRFMLSIAPNSAVYTLNQNCDTFLVAYFFGPINAGIFNVAKRIRLTLQLVSSGPINGIALPTLAEIQHDPERLHRGVLRSLTLIAVVCSPVFFGVSAVSHDALIVIFGQKWIAAAPILELLSFGGLAMAFQSYNDYIFILQNRQMCILYVSFTYSVLAILTFIICVKLKVESVALPFILPYLLVLPLSALLISKRINISVREWVAALSPGIGASLIMFAAVKIAEYYLAGTADFERLLISGILGAATYSVIIWTVWRNVAMMIIDVIKHMINR